MRLILFLLFICCSLAKVNAQTTIEVFNNVLFFDGYAARVDNPPSPAGVIRHRNDLYARKLTAQELASIGTTLNMRVIVSAACDNYDRIGNVNMAFVPMGNSTYNPNNVQRIEVGRYITPFMNKNVQPTSVPFQYDISNVAHLLRDSVILSQFDIWIELELFGVPYAANTQVAGCAGRNDVFFGSLIFETNTAAPVENDNVLIPLSMKRNIHNYNINNTDTLGKTTRRLNFSVPVDLTDATFYLITSNHGANTGGEEYNRRNHFIYVDEILSLTYKPGRTTCEPFRVYNTQGNGIYGSTPKTDAQWQSFSNWCPGDVIDIRKIEMGNLSAGAHSFRISVPDAQFVGADGYFPFSVYLQGKKSASVTSPPPPLPPANDIPCNAISLSAVSTCSYNYFNNRNATGTINVGNPNCANYIGGDVWFKVTAPVNGSLIIDTKADGLNNAGMAAYSGSCNNLTLIACDDTSGDGAMPRIALDNLTPNSTLWIRVWPNGTTTGGSFGICAIIPPPVNDEPCNAININPEFSCVNQQFSNISATASAGIPDPGCANYTGNDIWFKTTVPSNGILEIKTTAGTLRNGGMAVYTGSCDNLTLQACDDSSGEGTMPLLSFNNLTPASTVYIRLWQSGGTASGSFNICAVKQTGPFNDEPCSAKLLSVNTGCNYEISSNLNAGASNSVPDPGCADYQGKDIWFESTIPANGKVTINTKAGSLSDAGMAVYSGSCQSLALLACDDDSGDGNMPSINLNNLTPGNKIWTRVWSKGAANFGSFEICAVSNEGNQDTADLIVYPNPASDFLTVTGRNINSLKLIDMSGRLMYKKERALFTNKILMSNFATGIYNLQIVRPSGTIQRKVLISR